jgi:hypothetical protein
MPFTQTQLTNGARYAIETHKRNAPIDQINNARPLLQWFMKNKKPTTFGNGQCTVNIFTTNNGNYQNYFGADQVTHNKRDGVRQAKYQYANYHDGFWFDDDELAAAGIIMTDDGSATQTLEEAQILADKLEAAYMALRESVQTGLDIELLDDGTANPKACVGLDALVDTTPATGVVGTIDSATATYWRNFASMAISAANLLAQMELLWRRCSQFGAGAPDYIVCGETFLDAYRTACSAPSNAGVIQRQVVVQEKGGVGLDGSVSGLFFKGVPLVWNPSFEAMDVIKGAITHPWTKRCYFLNSKFISLQPMKGRWMQDSKPARLPDRYVTYWGTRSSYAMTTSKRSAHAVMSIA